MNNSTRPAIPLFYDNSKVISPWYKVPERLPDFDMPVWTATEEGHIYEAVLRVISSNEMAWVDNRGLTIEEKVFYWCPKNNGIEKPKAPTHTFSRQQIADAWQNSIFSRPEATPWGDDKPSLKW